MDTGEVTTTATPERCRHCGRQVHGQSIPIPNTDVKYVLFDYPDGTLHECIVKPLNPWKRKLIQQFIGESSNSSNNENNVVVEKLNTIIEILNQIKENINYIER